MNIILFEKSEVTDNTVLLTGDRAKHIVKVLRAKCGDVIRVGMINGKAGTGIVRTLSNRPPYSAKLVVSFVEDIHEKPVIDLLLALPRPIMLKRILREATALGIGTFHIVNATRVEKSFWDSNIIKDGTFRDYLIQGLEQAVDTREPEVIFHKGFKPFIERDLAVVGTNYSDLLVADPSFSTGVADVVSGHEGRIMLAVGPEGGWIDYELKKMTAAGFKGFGIGRRILKVDTAVIALHSMVSILRREKMTET